MTHEKFAFLGALVARFRFHVNNQYGQPDRELQGRPGDPKQGKSVKSRLEGISRTGNAVVDRLFGTLRSKRC